MNVELEVKDGKVIFKSLKEKKKSLLVFKSSPINFFLKKHDFRENKYPIYQVEIAKNN